MPDKEILIHGMLRQKFVRDDSGQKTVRYFILAETVELLPQFPVVKKENGVKENEK